MVVMRFVDHLKDKLASESGSASVEFVLLAIPLFLPILIFANLFAQLSHSELIARTLARESLRAFVTAPSVVSSHGRAESTLREVARAAGMSQEEIDGIKLDFQCSKFPCLSPDGRVRAKVKFKLQNQGREITAEAEEFLSPWQWNGLGFV